MTLPNAHAKHDFKKEVACFSGLMKTIGKKSGAFKYYTLPQTFLFPKSFVLDQTAGDKAGFYVVNEKNTQFCPFNFSAQTYGVKKSVKSHFQLLVSGQNYSMSYDHKKRQFAKTNTGLGGLFGRSPASVKKPLHCESVAAKDQPLEHRLFWLVDQLRRDYSNKKKSGKKVFAHKYQKFLKQSCGNVSEAMDLAIAKFPRR